MLVYLVVFVSTVVTRVFFSCLQNKQVALLSQRGRVMLRVC